MKLYFSRNPNPRLAVAAAKYLNSKIKFEFASVSVLGATIV